MRTIGKQLKSLFWGGLNTKSSVLNAAHKSPADEDVSGVLSIATGQPKRWLYELSNTGGSVTFAVIWTWDDKLPTSVIRPSTGLIDITLAGAWQYLKIPSKLIPVYDPADHITRLGSYEITRVSSDQVRIRSINTSGTLADILDTEPVEIKGIYDPTLV